MKFLTQPRISKDVDKDEFLSLFLENACSIDLLSCSWCDQLPPSAVKQDIEQGIRSKIKKIRAWLCFSRNFYDSFPPRSWWKTWIDELNCVCQFPHRHLLNPFCISLFCIRHRPRPASRPSRRRSRDLKLPKVHPWPDGSCPLLRPPSCPLGTSLTQYTAKAAFSAQTRRFDALPWQRSAYSMQDGHDKESTSSSCKELKVERSRKVNDSSQRGLRFSYCSSYNKWKGCKSCKFMQRNSQNFFFLKNEESKLFAKDWCLWELHDSKNLVAFNKGSMMFVNVYFISLLF